MMNDGFWMGLSLGFVGGVVVMGAWCLWLVRLVRRALEDADSVAKR